MANGRRLLLITLVLAGILGPFFLFEADLARWTEEALAGAGALLVVGLLAADVVLPIPSSLVAAWATAHLGPLVGGVAVGAGFFGGGMLGYLIGRGTSPLARRLVGAADLTRARTLADRHGAWVYVLCRPVPVLSEASAILAGTAGYPLVRFAALTAVSSGGVALGYAGIAAGVPGPWALGGGVVVPLAGIAMLGLWQATTRRSRESGSSVGVAAGATTGSPRRTGVAGKGA